MPSAVSSPQVRSSVPDQAGQRLPLPMRVPALLLCVSGAAALVYQVLWVKQLSLVVGVEVYAITAGISAFLPGWHWVAWCSAAGPIACAVRSGCMPAWSWPWRYWVC